MDSTDIVSVISNNRFIVTLLTILLNKRHEINMKIGICGPHRVGKTTLAMMYGNTYNINTILLSTSSIFKINRISPKDRLSKEKRLNIQYQILQNFIQTVKRNNNFIIDRTPVDMIAYTVYDIGIDKDIEHYISKCIYIHKLYISKTIVIPPGIPMEESENSAICNKDVIYSIYDIIKYTLLKNNIKYTFIHNMDKKERVKELNSIINKK